MESREFSVFGDAINLVEPGLNVCLVKFKGYRIVLLVASQNIQNHTEIV
jgi:hypothetical protein